MTDHDNDNDNNTDRRAAADRAHAAAAAPLKPLPKRFYKDVRVADGANPGLLLDGRPVKTPGKRSLSLPTRALAQAIANEWAAQQSIINPATMPLTRFANTAIDAVSQSRDAVAADIVAYAASDLICYRAASPVELIVTQEQHWEPVIDWARDTLGADFMVVQGVMPIEQPESALRAFAQALQSHDTFELTAQHVLTTLTGSALLSLAYSRGVLSADQTWTAAHVDEHYQLALWGADEEAAARRVLRRAEFDAAVTFLSKLTAGPA